MDLEASAVLGAIAVGIGATLIMDFWNLFLKRAFSIPSRLRRWRIRAHSHGR